MSDKSKNTTGQGRPKKTGPASPGKPIDPVWAWAPYEPDARRPWDLPRAGHLFRRAAFGATWDRLQRALADGPARTIDALLRPDAEMADFDKTYDEYDAAAARSNTTDGLRAWWLRRMIQTPHPLLEKMTLFWHGYFAVSGAKVESAGLMLEHVQLLRRYALGRFEPLLEAVSHDPAMLLSFGAAANRKARPSGDFARALLGQFGLGAGNFSEEDASEVARAFTGWFVLRNELRYIPREHDDGAKSILGQKGDWGSKDAVRILLRQPAAPRRVVRKLYRWLVSETDEPGDAMLAPLAESYAKDYDTGKLVETMLRSNLFFSPVAYRRRVKCPVEFALGIIKGLEGMAATARLGSDLAALGQNLYRPPTVKGWQGGRNWINSSTMIGRSNLALALVSGAGPYGNKLDPLAVARKHGKPDAKSACPFLLDLFLQGDVDPKVRETLLASTAESPPAGDNPSQRLRRFVHTILTLPEFQLA